MICITSILHHIYSTNFSFWPGQITYIALLELQQNRRCRNDTIHMVCTTICRKEWQWYCRSDVFFTTAG